MQKKQLLHERLPYSHTFSAVYRLLIFIVARISFQHIRWQYSHNFPRMRPAWCLPFPFVPAPLCCGVSCSVFPPSLVAWAVAKSRPLPLLNYLQCNPCLPEFSSSTHTHSLSFTFSLYRTTINCVQIMRASAKDEKIYIIGICTRRAIAFRQYRMIDAWISLFNKRCRILDDIKSGR